MGRAFTNIILISVLKKVLVVGFPCDNICKPGAKFRILIVAGNLTSFEPEACVDPKGLIVEVPLGVNCGGQDVWSQIKSEHVLGFLRYGGPVCWQIDIWMRAGGAQDGKLPWRSPIDTGQCVGPSTSLQKSQVAPHSEHTQKLSVTILHCTLDRQLRNCQVHTFTSEVWAASVRVSIEM